MSQFDDFNERVERVKAEADRESARRSWRQGEGDMGFGWTVLQFFVSLVGEIFARTFVWIIGVIFVVASVSAFIGVSFQTALFIVGVAAIAALAFAMSG